MLGLPLAPSCLSQVGKVGVGQAWHLPAQQVLAGRKHEVTEK